jgi:glycosyltransferase involved in cell wall biosynthesis
MNCRLDRPLVSFAILTHNETGTLSRLLESLAGVPETEVRIVDDFSDPPTLAIIDGFVRRNTNIHLYRRALRKNFAAQRNFVAEKCLGRYIGRIDADETLPRFFIENLKKIVEDLEAGDFDAAAFPRINLLGEEAGESFIKEFTAAYGRFELNDKGWLNFPDFQIKLYRNAPHLKFRYIVHEILLGINKLYRFPAEEKYALIHHKSPADYLNSIRFYNTFTWKFLGKWERSFHKRWKWGKPRRNVALGNAKAGES